MRLTKIAFVPIIVLSLIGTPAQAHAEPRVLQTLTTSGGDPVIPLGVAEAVELPSRGERLVEIALSQLGVMQDCTDLVQNSLAVMGLVQRRDEGGYDYGVHSVALTFGYEVPWEDARPGDVAAIGPADGGHVWIILDPAENLGIHGGWNGGTTAVGVWGTPLSAHNVYRISE